MTGASVILGALGVTPVVCAVLLTRKLLTMLFGTSPYWIRREGFIDKSAQRSVHAFYVGSFALALITSICLFCIFLWSLLNAQ